MRVFVIISLGSLFFGCVNDQMGSWLASWQGSHFNEVAAVWGPPEALLLGPGDELASGVVTTVPADR